MSTTTALIARAKTAVSALSPVGRSYWQNFTNAVVVYLLLTRAIKAQRHLRARGVLQTLRDLYKWVLQVRKTSIHSSCTRVLTVRVWLRTRM